MKKLFYAVILATLALAGCKKDESTSYQFEGCQWITEEIESVSMYPRHQILMDVGFTKPGVAYYAVVICEGDSNYSEGDIVKTLEKSYSYDPSTGLLSIGPDELKISFINNDMIKAERNPEDIQVFTRATKKDNLRKAIDPVGPSEPSGPSEPEKLEIWPETESEWAGGSVQINANRDDVTWSFEVKGHPVDGAPYQNGSLATSISDNGLLTLAMYKKRLAGSGYSITDAVIVVTAKTADDQTATCEVTSKAWKLVVYDNQVANGSPLTPEDVHSGYALAFGPHSDDGKIIEDWRTSGFDWKHNCLHPFGWTSYISANVLTIGQIGDDSWGITDKNSPYYISITYGKYEDKMIIPDLDF
mgnify:CR=1 FL=1